MSLFMEIFMLRVLVFFSAMFVFATTVDAGPLEDCLDANDSEAIEICSPVIEKMPNDPKAASAYHKRGVGFEFSKPPKLDDAIADYSKAIELDPARGVSFFRRAFCYQGKGDLEQAAQDFRKTLSFYPDDEISKERLEQLSGPNPQDCKGGTTVSISGVITEVTGTLDGMFVGIQQDKPGCKVHGILFDKISTPQECVVGASVTVSGEVDEENGLYDPEDVTCD